MKSLFNLLICLMGVLIAVSYSCNNDDDDPSGCNWASEVQAEADAFTAAYTTYINNPTTANCNAYVSAGQSYLAELESHLDCAALAGTQAELQSSIDASQAALDATQC